MRTFLGFAALVIAVVALIVWIVALLEARDRPDRVATYQDVTVAAVRQIHDVRNKMTPPEVEALLGRPDEIYRDNPRALCWRYTDPYRIEMCWGPKRKQFWIAHNISPQILGYPS